MMLQKLIDFSKGKFQDNAKLFVLVLISVSLTAIALIMTKHFLEQKSQATLIQAGLGFQSEVMQAIEDEEDALPQIFALLTKETNDFDQLAQEVLDAHAHYLGLEIRDENGRALAEKLSANAQQQWGNFKRVNLPAEMDANFKKSIAERKMYWAQSLTPTGGSALDVIVPSASRHKVMVVRLNHHYWLAHVKNARLPKGMRAYFSFEPRAVLPDPHVFEVPLSLRGLDFSLVFSDANLKETGMDPFSVIIFAMGLSLLILLMSFNAEVKQARLTQHSLAKQELTIAKRSQLSTLGEISTALAHELNQPLSTITNYIATCEIRLKQLGYSDKILDKALKNARAQTLRAGEVVQSIRLFLKRGPAVHAVVGYQETISQLLPILKAMVKESQASLEVNHEPGLFAKIDPSLFEQIIVNLCKNGLDAMEDVPTFQKKILLNTFTYQAENGSEWARVEVVDRGHGVQDEYSSKLFDSFFTTKKNGLGIGLNLCRSIAESYGGRILWKNNDGVGATFSLELPKALDPVMQSPLTAI